MNYHTSGLDLDNFELPTYLESLSDSEVLLELAPYKRKEPLTREKLLSAASSIVGKRTYQAIAKELGVSMQGIYRLCKKLGISKEDRKNA